jgi:HD-GYP domain-containing protein (c-di-GMP phosphodiesterase class II)
VLRGLETRILAVADVHAALTEASALPDAEL